MSAEATSQEVAAVDSLIGEPESSWGGGKRRPADLHISYGGPHTSAALRHLLLPVLLAVQGTIGWVSEGALSYISARLLVPPADAYGVASFYSLISTEQRPARVAHVCDDICCRDRGGLEILAALAGRDDIVPSPCLGQCDRAPAVLVQRAGQHDLTLSHTTVEEVLSVLEGDEPDPTEADVPQEGQAGLRLLGRIGSVDPNSLDEYRASGGYSSLAKAIEIGSDSVIAELKASNLKGRGGAAFPIGIKWEGVARSSDLVRYVICNADESEPGTFKDRVLMEGDPFAVVEAMTIAGLTVGAERGYVYIRAEYPLATARLTAAIQAAESAGLLGGDVAGSGRRFDLEIRSGAGAYICGEETALMNSIEGGRGEPRNKPPFPTQVGLFGRPTVINNVETLVNVLDIVRDGGAAFSAIGTEQSTGTKLFCLSGDVAVPGVYEVEFGVTLGELIDLAGGVSGTGNLSAVLLGGAAGSFVSADQMDMPLTFEGTRTHDASLGSGVVMVFDDRTDFRAVTRRIAEFFRDESCGQCVPCRVGTVRQEELLARHLGGGPLENDLLDELAMVMADASICGLGHTASVAIRSAMKLGLI